MKEMINVSSDKLSILKEIEKCFLICNGDIIYFENLKYEFVTEKNIFGKPVHRTYITNIDICRYSIDDEKEYYLSEEYIGFFLDHTPNELRNIRRKFIKFRKQLEGLGYHIIKNKTLEKVE